MSFVVSVPSRSWVEPDVSALDAERVVSVLVSRCGEWLSASDIAREAGLSVGGTEPRVRAAIRVLVFRGSPIVSGRKGFRYLPDKFAVARAALSLRRRADALNARAARLEEWQ